MKCVGRANGSAISTVTVHVKDSAGNDLQSSAGAVGLHASLGTLSPATDLHNGSYTAALTAGTRPQAAGRDKGEADHLAWPPPLVS